VTSDHLLAMTSFGVGALIDPCSSTIIFWAWQRYIVCAASGKRWAPCKSCSVNVRELSLQQLHMEFMHITSATQYSRVLNL